MSASAHPIPLEIQSTFGHRGRIYWFDELMTQDTNDPPLVEFIHVEVAPLGPLFALFGEQGAHEAQGRVAVRSRSLLIGRVFPRVARRFVQGCGPLAWAQTRITPASRKP